MSGTIQGAPTASMTVASGRAGVFATGYGYLPPEGSRCVAAQYDWTVQSGYVEDLSGLVARGVETTIQAAYIDNSTVSQPVSIIIAGSGQALTVPGGAQGLLPLLFTGAPSFQISVAAIGAGTTRVYLLNTPPLGGASIWAAGVGAAGAAADFSANAAAVPIAGLTLLATIPATGGRRYIEVQNQSAGQLQLVKDDGAGGSLSSILLASGGAAGSQGGGWSSTTFAGRLRIYGAAGAEVAAWQE